MTNKEQQLADALMEMVAQHCYPDDMWVYSHSFMSADELAFSTLVECGYAEWMDVGKAHIRFLPSKDDIPPLDPDPEISGYTNDA